MPLNPRQAVQVVVTRPSQKALEKAKADNDRQRFHSYPATDRDEVKGYAEKFENWINGVLSNVKKFARFNQLLRYPLPSINLIDKSADQYSKCFEAEDQFRAMEFTDSALETDASEYLDKIHFVDFIQKKVFNQCLRAASAVWVIDLPSEPNEEGYAQPKPHLIEAKDLTDIAVDSDGNVGHVAFKLSPLKDDKGETIAERWAVICDEYYRVLIDRKSGGEPEVFIEHPHFLGRCPSGLIWHDRLSDTEPLRVQSALHAELTRLDYYVAAWVFRQHADLYAAFPILWRYKKPCSYISPEGNQCNNGLIYLPASEDRREPGKMPCPACSAQNPIGPGSEISVPQPQGGPDSADMREPAGFIGAERDLLDYNAEKVDALGLEIVESLTGDQGQIDQTAEAVNEEQVHARFESRKAVVMYWATNLERTESEMLSVLLALRYGPQFLSLALSYGTEFHLLSPGQAIADYDLARKAGLPSYQMMTRRQRIDRLLAGASERTAMRYTMLAQLEPYPDLALSIVPAGSDVWELKANFSYYVDRFERENGPIELFGAVQTLSTRIATITQTLYSYVTADKARREVPQPEGGAVGPGGTNAK